MILKTLLLAAVAATADPTPFPQPSSIKGIQVQMTEDAISLGVQHATINVNLTSLLDPSDPLKKFNEGYLRSLDAQIKPLADAKIVVYAILLAIPAKNAERDSIAIHPSARPDYKYTIAGFNSVTPEGRAWLSAVTEMLAQRWKGQVWGWIVGNEINSHWLWYNMGNQPLKQAASEYENAFRIVHGAVRRVSQHSRLYLSLDHHWRISMNGISANEALPGRDFLDTFAALVRERGDLDWHLAHHPYPEDLGNPRLWADKNIDNTDDTIKVTFKNLQVLSSHLHRPELLYDGKPRRIILSEQGFHTLASPDGQQLQAAAYAYAWEKCQREPLVDAFIYHRHVDHAKEGGVRFGLWTHKPGSIFDPHEKKLIYELFRKAGTPEWNEAAKFALPICGLTSWDQLGQ